MKLRSRLLLSSGALLTVALLGLLLGMFSVLQLSTTQNQAMARNMTIIDATMGMRQEVGKQVFLMISEELDQEALRTSDESFRRWLTLAGSEAMDNHDIQALTEIQRAYSVFASLISKPQAVRRELLSNNEFSLAAESIRDRINAAQKHYVAEVQSAEQTSRERAQLIAWLLGLIGIAVLLIGFVTANSIAQRFGRPIESLAHAADQIGQGDFQVTLPISPVAELSALSRRFGLMAEALRQFKHSNVEALQGEQQRLRAVLDSIDDGLLIFDCNGLLEEINPIAQRQLGWTHQHIGQSPGEALHYPELDAQLEQVLRGESPEHAFEDLEIIVDGQTRLLSYSLTSIDREEGGFVCAVMVLRDVTEQRAFERVRNEFVLRASHELRTPVTGMHMAFALLRERLHFPEDARESDLLHTVEEEMQRLLLLINELLNFSRYQSGQQKLDAAPCDLRELLDSALQRFSAQAAEQDMQLLLELHPDLPEEVLLDRLQIERVLDNLIANALRHSNPGGRIQIQARRQGKRVFISVEDEGEGIPYNHQVRIFEPFVQVGRKKGGAGLGLALCKEIAQLHGGHIGMHSRPGQGTQFYLELPL